MEEGERSKLFSKQWFKRHWIELFGLLAAIGVLYLVWRRGKSGQQQAVVLGAQPTGGGSPTTTAGGGASQADLAALTQQFTNQLKQQGRQFQAAEQADQQRWAQEFAAQQTANQNAQKALLDRISALQSSMAAMQNQDQQSQAQLTATIQALTKQLNDLQNEARNTPSNSAANDAPRSPMPPGGTGLQFDWSKLSGGTAPWGGNPNPAGTGTGAQGGVTYVPTKAEFNPFAGGPPGAQLLGADYAAQMQQDVASIFANWPQLQPTGEYPVIAKSEVGYNG